MSQVGGNHYNLPIQPIEYILKNGLGFCEGNIIKYVSRYQQKNGVEDLRKARHYLDLLIKDVLREQEMPAFNEDRMDRIGQNGNDGSHYEEM